MRGQNRNRGAQKMNLFTSLVELWLYDSQNLCSKHSFIEHLYGPPISHGGFSEQLPGRLFSPSDRCKKLSHHFLLHFSIIMARFLSPTHKMVDIETRYRQRFFDQVGHQTMYASMGNKHFITRELWVYCEPSHQKCLHISVLSVFCMLFEIQPRLKSLARIQLAIQKELDHI